MSFMPSPVKTVGIYFDLLQEQLQELPTLQFPEQPQPQVQFTLFARRIFINLIAL